MRCQAPHTHAAVSSLLHFTTISLAQIMLIQTVGKKLNDNF
jgi:hypothetical protein